MGPAKSDEKTKDTQRPSARDGPVSTPPVPALRPADPVPALKLRVWLWVAVAVPGLGFVAFACSQIWMARTIPVVIEYVVDDDDLFSSHGDS